MSFKAFKMKKQDLKCFLKYSEVSIIRPGRLIDFFKKYKPGRLIETGR